MIAICLLVFGALLLMGSMGAFFFYVRFLSIAAVVVMLLGMILVFLIGVFVGGTQGGRLRLLEQHYRGVRLRRDLANNEVSAPLALTLPPDE